MLMRFHPEFQITHPLPYGAVVHDGGVQFIVFSRTATSMRLLLYNEVDDLDPVEIISFDYDTDRWGHVWSIFVSDVRPGQLYHLQADGPHDPQSGQWFDGRRRLIDPYAKALAGDFQSAADGVIRPPKCVVCEDSFDWEGDRHLRRPLSESVIYELHVRGFTQSPTSGVEHPGTYLGLIEKIPYLKSLGITAVELMPVHEFPMRDVDGNWPRQRNYWGYDPMALFAPHRGFAAGDQPGSQVNEFKEMVKALHQADIEVILDVVFNHTCEGNHLGPVLSFKGLENQVYYMLDNGGSRYKNYSGCGNTINGNHPVVREMIFNCLRHWVYNYHVDGFRFDLASILSRDRKGNLVPNPPLVEMIAEDPMLADTKIIAEAWDAAGAYQVGSFGESRWAEWNGRYRDDMRRYWRGDTGLRGAAATRLAGSSDLYQPNGRHPSCSINFITSHDGFTLNDQVSFRDKHNEDNGEGNRDGDNNGHSDNYGIEGLTNREPIKAVRLRQIKNMLATLLLSQGVPMMLAGDECRRTQQGNNNPWCQDNEITWFDWDLVTENAHLVQFCRELIHFRRRQPTVRRETFLDGEPNGSRKLPDVVWFDVAGRPIDWNSETSTIGAWLKAPEPDADPNHIGCDVLLLLNPTDADQHFHLPSAVTAKKWHQFVDTSAPPPADIYPEKEGPMLTTTTVQLMARSLCCLTSKVVVRSANKTS